MKSLVDKFILVLLHPCQAIDAVKNEGEDASLNSAMIFIAVMGLLSGIITSIVGFIMPPPQVSMGAVSKLSLLLAIPLVPFLSFLLSFVGAFILWGLVHGLLKSSLSEYKTIYRIFALLAAFSPINSILAPIPVVGQWLAIAVNIWGIVVLIRGIITVVETPKIRTWVVLGSIFFVLFLLGLVFRNEAQRQMAMGGPSYSDAGLGAYGDDLGDEDALNKELEAMANQQTKTRSVGSTTPDTKK